MSMPSLNVGSKTFECSKDCTQREWIVKVECNNCFKSLFRGLLMYTGRFGNGIVFKILFSDSMYHIVLRKSNYQSLFYLFG